MREVPRIHLLLTLFAFFFFLAVPCGAQSIPSDLVQMVHTGVSQEPCTGVCNLIVPFPQASLAGNLLKMDFSWRYSGTVPTVSNIYCNSDTGHTTWIWTLAKSVLNPGDNTDTFSYYIAGAAPGCKTVTVVASSVWIDAEATLKEWREVATSSPVDATGGGIDTSGPAFSTSLTTTTANDLVDQFCTFAPIPGGWPQTVSQATASAGFTALDLETGYGYGSIAGIDASTGALTGTINFVGGPSGGDGNCTMVAFKTSAGAGTAPIGVHIIQQFDQTASGTGSPTFQAHIFNANDAVVFGGISGAPAPNSQWTGFSDTLGNTWQAFGNGGGGVTPPRWQLTCTSIAGDTLMHPTGGSNNDWNIQIVEIAGLKNSSNQACFDKEAERAGVDGGSTGVACPLPFTSLTCFQYGGLTITPTLATDLVIAQINEGVGPQVAVSTSPPGATFNYPLYTGITDAGDMNEGGGFSYFFNAGTSAITFTWFDTTPATTFTSGAIALEAGNTQGTPPAPPTGLQAIVQ
ncbi:MAG TPA: hypothetical protein VI431_12560 [Candidatus Acidoferrum sp.]